MGDCAKENMDNDEDGDVEYYMDGDVGDDVDDDIDGDHFKNTSGTLF